MGLVFNDQLFNLTKVVWISYNHKDVQNIN